MKIRALLFSLLSLASYSTVALTCTKTGSVCVDSTPCKKISGVDVCLNTTAVPYSCWKYTDTYSCLDKPAVDYCAAISAMPGCQQVASVCASPSSSGCRRWTNTYRCGTSTATRSNTVVLDSSYTVASEPTASTQCASPADNPTCTLASNANGVRSYTCVSQQSNCAALQTQGCTLNNSTCIIPSAGAANCVLYEKSYSCPTAGPTYTVLDCGSQQYCVGGNCFNTGHVPDGDFASAVVAHEVGRQASTYIDANQRIFGGNAESCDQDSLSRCCDPKGGAVKNSTIGQDVVRTAGGQVIMSGSAYMFDIMSNMYNAMRGSEAMMAAAATAAANTGFSMSAYGLTMTYSSTAGFSFAFDPTTFAVAVAVLVIVEVTSCPQDEKELAQKNGAGLCRHYSSSCNGYFCTSVTRRYCCFNSKLAKIINTAAVTQLGRANSDCSGLTMDEFGRLDLSAIDLSEFMAEIMDTATLPSTDAINIDVKNSVRQKLLNYYTRGKQ